MLSVCFCSCGVLLQRSPYADVAAAADGHPGLLWNTLLLHGGEDAELLCRSAGTLEGRSLLVEREAIGKTSHLPHFSQNFISVQCTEGQNVHFIFNTGAKAKAERKLNSTS